MKIYICYEFVAVSGAAMGEYGQGYNRNVIAFKHKIHAEEWVKKNGGREYGADYDEIELVK